MIAKYCCGSISSESALPVALTKVKASIISVVVHKIQLLTYVVINTARAVIVCTYRQPNLNMPNPYLTSHCDRAQVIMEQIFRIVKVVIM